MAILWGDGFQHYGETGWINSDSGAAINFRQSYVNNVYSGGYGGLVAAPTGMNGPRCLSISGQGFAQNSVWRNVPSRQCLYSGCRIRPTDLQTQAIHFIGTGSSWNGGNTFSLRTLSNGGVALYRGTTLLARNDNLLVNPSQAYFSEIKVNAVSGQLVARVNKREVLTVNGLNIPALLFTNVGLGVSDSTGAAHYFGDFHIGDNLGTKNNDFIGDRIAKTNYLLSDEALNQWTLVGGASGHGILSNVPSLATQYIEALNNGDISRFGLEGVSSNTISIAAAIVMGRLGKTDSGAASAGMGLELDGYADYGEEIVMGINTANYARVFEELPNGVALTPSNFNRALARVERLT